VRFAFRRSTPPTFRPSLVCMQVKRIFGAVCTLHSLLSVYIKYFAKKITFAYYLCCTFLPSLCCFPSHFACFLNDQISCKTLRNCSLLLQYFSQGMVEEIRNKITVTQPYTTL
jgi:hypothetical protein